MSRQKTFVTNYTPRFLEWYKAYPRKVAKGQAAKMFAKLEPLLDNGSLGITFQELLEITRQFANSDRGRSGKYCPHPSTWLSRQQWEDDPAEWQDSEKGQYRRGEPAMPDARFGLNDREPPMPGARF